MISYINYFLIAGIVIYLYKILRHEGVVTQAHLDGDWRQTLHETFHSDPGKFENVKSFTLGISFIVSCVHVVYLSYDQIKNHFHLQDGYFLYFIYSVLGYIFLFLAIHYEEKIKLKELTDIFFYIFCLSQIPIFFVVFSLTLFYNLILILPSIPITYSIKWFSEFVYYNPKGRYVLVKQLDKYHIKELSQYPKTSFPTLLQSIGKDKNSSFRNENDIIDAICRAKNKDMIISNFSEETLKRWDMWNSQRSGK